MIKSDKIMNLADGKVLYDDLRSRSDNSYSRLDAKKSDKEDVDILYDDVLDVQVIPSRNINKTQYPASATKNGVTITKNSDGSLSVSGQATSTTEYNPGLEDGEQRFQLPAGNYAISGGISADLKVEILFYSSKTATTARASIRAGANPQTFTLEAAGWVCVGITIYDTTNDLTGNTFYPQLETGTTATEYQDPTEIIYKSQKIEEKYTKPSGGIPASDIVTGLVIPTGGSTGQVLAKKSATDRDVEWKNPSGGGSTETQYRVIKTITIDNSTTSTLYINTDSNGDQFELTEVVIDFNMTAASGISKGCVGINIGQQQIPSNPNEYGVLCTQSTIYYSSGTRRATANIRVRGGKLFGEINTNNSNGNYADLPNLTRNFTMSGIISCDKIRNILVWSLNEHTMGNGSVITIYGR